MKTIYERLKMTPEEVEQLMRDAYIYAERIHSERLGEAASDHRQKLAEIKAEGERKIPEHQKAIRAAVVHILQLLDQEDPVVAFMGVTITRDGQIQSYRHGAIEPDTAGHAIQCLSETINQYLRALALQNCSPLTSRFTGAGGVK